MAETGVLERLLSVRLIWMLRGLGTIRQWCRGSTFRHKKTAKYLIYLAVSGLLGMF